MINNIENNVVVDVVGLEKSFGKNKVLKGIDLKIKKGEKIIRSGIIV